MDPRSSPERIGRTHLSNELTKFPSHCGSPGCVAPTFPGSIEAESFSVPSDNRFRLHDEQRRAPIRPEAAEPNPEKSIRGVWTKRHALTPLQDCELVTESKNLDLQRCPSSEPRSEAGKQGRKK